MSLSVALVRDSLNTGNTSGNNAKSKIINRNESRKLSNVIKADKLFSSNQIELITNNSGKKLLNNRQNKEQLSDFFNSNKKNNNKKFLTEMSSNLTTNINLNENDGNKLATMDKTLNASRNDEIRATGNTSQHKRISAIPVPISRNSELSNNDRKTYLNQVNANYINNQSISSTIATKKLDEISSQSVFYSTPTKSAAFLTNSPIAESIMNDVQKGHKRSSSLASSDETRPIFSKSLANKIANAKNNYQSRVSKNTNSLKPVINNNESNKNVVSGLQKPNSKLPLLNKQTSSNKLAVDSSISLNRQKDNLKPIQSSSTVSSLSTKSSKLTAIPLQSNSNRTK